MVEVVVVVEHLVHRTIGDVGQEVLVIEGTVQLSGGRSSKEWTAVPTLVRLDRLSALFAEHSHVFEVSVLKAANEGQPFTGRGGSQTKCKVVAKTLQTQL